MPVADYINAAGPLVVANDAVALHCMKGAAQPILTPADLSNSLGSVALTPGDGNGSFDIVADTPDGYACRVNEIAALVCSAAGPCNYYALVNAVGTIIASEQANGVAMEVGHTYFTNAFLVYGVGAATQR